MTDEEIVEKIWGKEVGLFREIVERYENKLKRYFRRLVNRSEQEVEDLTEETLIRAYENINGFERGKKFSSWIYRIGHNLAVDLMRKKQPLSLDRLENYEDWWEDDTILFEELEIQRENRALVNRGLFKIEPKYREVLELYFYEEKSYEEIADVLRTTKSNVGVMIKRGKEKLKKVLEVGLEVN